MTDRNLTLLLTLSLLALPLGCPGTDDDDSADDDDTTADDDDTVDDDDTTADDDDTVDDDDSANLDLDSLTLTSDAVTTDTRGAITLTVQALWSDGGTSTPTAADGLEIVITTLSGPAVASYAAPSITSPSIVTLEVVARLDGVDSPALALAFTGAAPQPGDLILHELLVDGTAGDANGDGTTDGDQDAFVEFLNLADVELDLGGCTLTERDFDPNLPRHTFAAGSSVGGGQALVVFGGGSADISPPGASVFVADNASDPGAPLFLHLDPTGDIVRLRDAAGTLLVELPFGSESSPLIDANVDESITLSPQITGTTWDLHSTVAGSAALYSPGTRADGTAFVPAAN